MTRCILHVSINSCMWITFLKFAQYFISRTNVFPSSLTFIFIATLLYRYVHVYPNNIKDILKLCRICWKISWKMCQDVLSIFRTFLKRFICYLVTLRLYVRFTRWKCNSIFPQHAVSNKDRVTLSACECPTLLMYFMFTLKIYIEYS